MPLCIPQSWIEAVNRLKINLVTEDGFSHMCMGITVIQLASRGLLRQMHKMTTRPQSCAVFTQHLLRS